MGSLSILEVKQMSLMSQKIIMPFPLSSSQKTYDSANRKRSMIKLSHINNISVWLAAYQQEGSS